MKHVCDMLNSSTLWDIVRQYESVYGLVHCRDLASINTASTLRAFTFELLFFGHFRISR
jgi:hypothetical protein